MPSGLRSKPGPLDPDLYSNSIMFAKDFTNKIFSVYPGSVKASTVKILKFQVNFITPG
jgi:hypothetical protein